MSINQDLTYGASFCPENDIICSTGNEGQNICVDFSETAPLQRYTACCIVCDVYAVRHFGKLHVSVTIACAFSNIHTHVALTVLHFSAIIALVYYFMFCVSCQLYI